MTNAKIDGNRVKTLICPSNADGLTPVLIFVNPSTGRIKLQQGSSGSDLGTDEAPRDENHKLTWIGVSADDGVTPTPVFADPSTNEVLVRYT